MSLIERSFTFDNFIVGPCNRHAYAACMEAFENPGGPCNPLFIYGETGTGKTHLLRAIRSMASRSDQKAIFLSGRKACGDGLLPLIQRDMDSPEPIADYLLIDDLQEILCSVDDVKAVLFLFESFERFQPQVVVTSSTAPTMLRGKGSDSLLRRICGGFIVRISSLDIQTRLSITMNEITKMNLPVRGKVASILADLPLSNYSHIRTILLRLLAEADEHIDIDDDFTIGLVTRMIKAGELHFPEGFNLPRKPAAGSLKSPLMEQSGGSHVISYHDQKPISHTIEESTRYLS